MRDFTNQYNLYVLINGNRITEYQDNEGNLFVEGRHGSNYEIEVHNNSDERILAVVSVDQLSVLDGQMANYNSPGYVIGAHKSVFIPGWKLDNQKVASFKFGSTESSYATRGGSGTKTGVIGLAVFREKKPLYNYNTLIQSIPFNGPLNTGYKNGGISSNTIATIGENNIESINDSWHASGSNATLDSNTRRINPKFTKDTTTTINNMGTQFGESQRFNTIDVTFNKRDPNYPDAIMALHYDDQRGLERRGIRIREQKYNNRIDPFPSYNSTGCKPPPGYTGR